MAQRHERRSLDFRWSRWRCGPFASSALPTLFAFRSMFHIAPHVRHE
jgi:hypothetical protein